MALLGTGWHPVYVLSSALQLCLLCVASESYALHVTSIKRTTCEFASSTKSQKTNQPGEKNIKNNQGEEVCSLH